jgi:hypothetical protein
MFTARFAQDAEAAEKQIFSFAGERPANEKKNQLLRDIVGL